tara:strand:+ start:358 stop:663 length:306 start_codon:yes stop_codon:yes gene_type:complete
MNVTDLETSIRLEKNCSEKIKFLIALGKTQKAELIASERHHSLTKLLKSDHLCQESKLSLIQKVSMLIKEEHTLANEIKSKDKSHFVLKRHAVKAYMQKAA